MEISFYNGPRLEKKKEIDKLRDKIASEIKSNFNGQVNIKYLHLEYRPDLIILDADTEDFDALSEYLKQFFESIVKIGDKPCQAVVTYNKHIPKFYILIISENDSIENYLETEDSDIKIILALKGYSLDKLASDDFWFVRYCVATQGYNLRQFLQDKDEFIRNFAYRSLNKI